MFKVMFNWYYLLQICQNRLLTVSIMCQEDPRRFPWQWATERIALIHCKFLAVSITGPWCADDGREAVGKGVPEFKYWQWQIMWYDLVLCVNIEMAYAAINFHYLTNSNNLVSYITFSAHSRCSVWFSLIFARAWDILKIYILLMILLN